MKVAINKIPSFVELIYTTNTEVSLEEDFTENWCYISTPRESYIGFTRSSSKDSLIILMQSVTPILLVLKETDTIVFNRSLQETFPKLSETSDTELLAFHVEFGVDIKTLEELREILKIFENI